MKNESYKWKETVTGLGKSLSLFIFFIFQSLITILQILVSSPTNRIALSQKWAKIMIKAFDFNLKVKGTLPTFPCIYVANHRSYMDIPIILSQVEATFLAKIEIASWPVIGWGTKLLRTILVNRDNRASRKQALSQIDQNLKHNQSVVLFPEGTTARYPKNNPFRPGVFYLAAKEQHYVVPITIEYADPADAWIDDEAFVPHFLSRFRRPFKQVTLIIGEPVTGSDGERLRQHAQNEILRQITKIHESPWGVFTNKWRKHENKNAYQISYLYRPGLNLSEEELAKLTNEFKELAKACFEETPDYQCLKGTKEELEDKVITIARRADGSMAGFSSALLLKVVGLGSVLHLGLTCTHPLDRHAGLTHKLSFRLLFQYMATRSPHKRIWISNVACVLSSLGNIALHFENVYPSPYGVLRPSREHCRVAAAIDKSYRDKIYIRNDAVFDPKNFVFQGSVHQTSFQKSEFDRQYWHRNERLNNYYKSFMNFEKGDEILQVGTISLMTPLKYLWKNRKKPKAPTFRMNKPGFQIS